MITIWQSEQYRVVFDMCHDEVYLQIKQSGVIIARMPCTEIQTNDDIWLIVDTLQTMVGIL